MIIPAKLKTSDRVFQAETLYLAWIESELVGIVGLEPWEGKISGEGLKI